MVRTQAVEPVNPIKQYEIIARPLPKGPHEKPNLFRMKIFAPNAVVARSRFWYFMSKYERLKRANGEVVQCKEIVETSDKVKNFGVWIRYNSRSNIRNMYKEYRDVNMAGAVNQMYQEMASRHRARFFSIQVRKVEELAQGQEKREHIIQFSNPEVKFPPIWKKNKIEKSKRLVFVPKSKVMPTL
ncbi:hypothetical protein ABK040_012891 [Willaertia magna]